VLRVAHRLLARARAGGAEPEVRRRPGRGRLRREAKPAALVGASLSIYPRHRQVFGFHDVKMPLQGCARATAEPPQEIGRAPDVVFWRKRDNDLGARLRLIASSSDELEKARP